MGKTKVDIAVTKGATRLMVDAMEAVRSTTNDRKVERLMIAAREFAAEYFDVLDRQEDWKVDLASTVSVDAFRRRWVDDAIRSTYESTHDGHQGGPVGLKFIRKIHGDMSDKIWHAALDRLASEDATIYDQFGEPTSDRRRQVQIQFGRPGEGR